MCSFGGTNPGIQSELYKDSQCTAKLNKDTIDAETFNELGEGDIIKLPMRNGIIYANTNSRIDTALAVLINISSLNE